MNNQQKTAYIRQAIPITEKVVYLNTGTAGPLSTITYSALQEAAQYDFEIGRGSISSFKPLLDASNQLRQVIARLVSATPDEIALTHHTTEGMNIVAHGLNWQPHDEIITTSLEHEGGLLPLYILRQRHGVVVKVVNLAEEDPPTQILAKLEAAMTDRTRLLAFSHVAWNTGLRFPMEELVAMAHQRKVLTLVDAAQSVGAIPLNLPASGVDFYAMPGQKWLCGPEGTGALYVRKEHLSILQPTFMGFLSLEDPTKFDLTGYFMPAKGARRYETSSVYRPGIKAMLANLLWLEQKIGWEWIYERIRQLTELAYNALQATPNVTIITQTGPQSGLISFNLDGYNAHRVATKLQNEGIVIRSIPHSNCLRVSIGFYNNEDDIERLLSALRAVLEKSPDDLPEYRSPFA